MKTWGSIWFFLILSWHSLKAQDESLRFSRYDLEQGLSSRNVKCILKGSRGFLWIGTEDGLNRFDGREFKIYKYDANNPFSIAGNNINAIIESKDKNIWVATREGLSCFDPVSEKFTNYSVIKDGKLNRLSEYSLSIYIDRSGTVWGIGYAGIARYNPTTNDFTPFSPQKETPDQKRMYFKIAFEDHLGRFWLGSWNGLYLFDRKTGKSRYLKHSFKSMMTINDIYEDAEGRLLLGTWDYGLVWFDEKQNLFKSFLFDDKQSDSHNIVTSITETKTANGERNLWLSTSSGLMKLKIQKTQFPINLNDASLYRNEKANPESLQENGLNLVYLDDQGILWIGGSALNCLNPVKQFVKSINLSEFIKGGINKIYEDSQAAGGKTVWTCSWNDGINKYDSHFRRQKISNLPEIFSQNENARNTNDIIKDHKGRLWVASMDGLISFMDQKDRSELYFSKNKRDSSLSENLIMSLFEDSKHRIWAGTYTKGVNIIKDEGGSIYRFDDKRIGNNKYDFQTLSIFEDRSHRIWICTNMGLKLYDENKQDIITYNLPLYGKQSNVMINAICQDEEGLYWLATNYGLYEFVLGSGKFFLYNSSKGLCNDNISNLVMSKGRLILGTSNGLSVFTIKTKKFFNFYARDGLESNEFTLAFTLTKGNILYTGQQGLISYFNIDELIPSRKLPQVVLTGITIFDKGIDLKENQIDVKEIMLSHKQNFLTFSFTAPDFINPFQLKYMYKMEGLYNEWIDNDDRQKIVFSNLQPGSYILHIKTVSKDLINSGEETIVRLYIHPAFWQTWWFSFLVIIVVGASIYFVYRYKLREALKLERLRARISTDLHDDIGSTLSSISILSDIILRGEDRNDEKNLEMIHEIKQSSFALMDKMGDIVWSIDPKNDSIEKLMMHFKQFATQLFEAKGIDYEIEISENIGKIDLPMETRQHIYLIMKEAVNNMVKYSLCTRADIKVNYTSLALSIEVSDNGIGFDLSTVKKGNGIYNMLQRAKQINGELKIQSEPNKGTTMVLKIKIR